MAAINFNSVCNLNIKRNDVDKKQKYEEILCILEIYNVYIYSATSGYFSYATMLNKEIHFVYLLLAKEVKIV